MKTYLINSTRTFVILGAFGAAAAMTIPAHAISPQADTISVKIDKRDLATDRGVTQVYKTLAHKAKSSCETAGTRGIAVRLAERECAKQLLREFVENADSVKLTSYYTLQRASA